MNRGDICWYSFQAPDKRRPVLILTRDSAISVLSNVTIAPLTSTIRNIPTEVILNESDGVPRVCAANFDNIQTVPKRNINERIARLSTARMNEVTTAVAFALDLTLAR